MLKGVFSADGGSGGTGASVLDTLNGVAYNTMMIHDLHEVDGVEMGDAYITSFESDDQGPGSAATYSDANDTYDTASSGLASYGSIDVSGDEDTVITSLKLDTTELLSGNVIPFSSTEYDGVGDYFTSSDAVFKRSGANEFTWCCEFYSDDVTNSEQDLLANYAGGAGIYIAIAADGKFYVYVGTGGGYSTVPESAWNKAVVVADATNTKVYLNDTLIATVAAVGTPTVDLSIAGDRNGSSLLTGKMRNIEIYSGAASDPDDWVPGNTSSMTGTTLICQCAEGNGTNGQSITFTENGDPVTTDGDDVVSALVAGVNSGPEKATWVASGDPGTSGTVTLTNAAVGDNDGLTPAGAGTDVTFSNEIDTKYGVGASPDGSSNYIGNISSPVIDITGKTKTSALVTFSHKWASGSGTVGTDCVAEATKDGLLWATATEVTDLGATLSGTDYKYYSATIDISSLTGTDLQGRVRDLSTGKSEIFSMATYAVS